MYVRKKLTFFFAVNESIHLFISRGNPEVTKWLLQVVYSPALCQPCRFPVTVSLFSFLFSRTITAQRKGERPSAPTCVTFSTQSESTLSAFPHHFLLQNAAPTETSWKGVWRSHHRRQARQLPQVPRLGEDGGPGPVQ